MFYYLVLDSERSDEWINFTMIMRFFFTRFMIEDTLWFLTLASFMVGQ